MKELVISSREEGLRLDRYLERYHCNAQKNFIYKMLRKKNITLNGAKCSGNEKLAGGDTIRIFFSDETLLKFTSPQKVSEDRNACGMPETVPAGTGNAAMKDGKCQKMKLKVVYEDEDIVIIDKPSGMLSQKASAGDRSLVEYVTEYLLDTGSLTQQDLVTFRPGICNRLDRNTSGLVVAGKTIKGLQEMSEAFRERTLHKYYICVVAGRINERSRVSGYLVRDEKINKSEIYRIYEEAAHNAEPDMINNIETEYIPVASNDRFTLLKVNLITGRTHQIRAHLASLGHPIAGDVKYGSRQINKQMSDRYHIKSQMLHAYELDYPQRDLCVRTDIPKEFDRVLKGEQIWEHGIQGDLEALH